MTATPDPAPPLPDADCACFLDVDGTLIDIAETPDRAQADPALLDLVARLHRRCGGALALVSGRSLADLERRFGGLGVAMAGLHGVERLDAQGRRHVHAAPPLPTQTLRDALAPLLARHPGLLLEDKGMTLALHYRREPQMAEPVQRLMRELAGPGFEVQLGKCVAEIKPAGCSKGTALAEFLSEAPFCGRLPVFVGDDLNDEYAFDEVNRRDGISVKVGAGKSCARYRLADAKAVRRWLARIVE